MYKKWLDILSESRLLNNINQQSLLAMLQCLKPVRRVYRYREIVALTGSAFNGIGIIASGKIALSRDTCAGNRVILEILRPGDIFGEMVAFSNLSRWPYSVISHDDSSVFFLSPQKILCNCSNICRSHNILIANLLNILSNKALLLTRTIEHLSARRIRGKISSYLLEEYKQNNDTKINLLLNRNELADYLGIPRPSLSREMSNMKKDGIIDYHGNHLDIIDLAKLERVVDTL